MGMTEEFEVSLQVLRGFETDISFEVNEIKVRSTASDWLLLMILTFPDIQLLFIRIF